jgi:hypothetical protein
MLPAVKPEKLWLKTPGTASTASAASLYGDSLHMISIPRLGDSWGAASLREYQAIVTME